MSEKTINEPYVSDWYIVPSRIRRLPGITLAYLDVYETIFQFINKGRSCFLSNAALVERTGHSLRRIQEAIKFFEKHGELKRSQVGFKHYIVIPEMHIEVEPTNDKTLARGIAPPRARNCTPHARGIAPINKEDLNKEVLNKNPLPPKGGVIVQSDINEIFEHLWKIYPLKKAKQKALGALISILKGKTKEETQSVAKTIWEGLAACIAENSAKEQLQQQGGDIWMPNLPYLSTWLNQHRWEDDYQQPCDILASVKRKSGIVDINEVFKK